MIKNRDYIGISFEGAVVRFAKIRTTKSGIEVVRLDKLTLVDELSEGKQEEENVSFDNMNYDAESIFGIGEEEAETESDDDIINLDDLDTAEPDAGSFDLVDEAGAPSNNEMVLYNYFSNLDEKNHNIGINVPAGNTIFQFVKENDYSNLKKKELTELVEDKLKAIYGEQPQKNNYEYYLRNDGSIVIASVDHEPSSLQLINRVNDLYSGKLFISEVTPDEAAMVGLYKDHYQTDETQITALLKFGPKKCRMIFMLGDQILQVSPVINEGTESKSFLNTIFSKILFQLDTGEVPGLDRLIIYNNSIGESAIEFFRKNFPDLEIDDFEFDSEKFTCEENKKIALSSFTTAIGIASAAAGVNRDAYPQISFLPEYIAERQKVFQLHWHGFLLLLLIGLSPIIINYYYQQNAQTIESLSNNITQFESQIRELNPVVDQTNEFSENLAQLQDQIVLLDTLSQGTIRWTVSLDKFNNAVNDIGGMWITNLRQANDNLMVEGVSLFRNRIPQLARQFSEVTLLNVRKDLIREREVFIFNFMIKEIVPDRSAFSPENLKQVREVLNRGEE
jgi:Tfp pilus assembly protein PilN